MNQETKNLIKTGTIICGRVVNENGIVRFERVDPSQIESIPEDERGFATASMGRAIFTIDKEGLIHNIKGVDSHLSTSELGMMDLVKGKAIEYTPEKNGYKVSAVVFHGKNPEIRINGASPLEDIEIEGDINKKLSNIGVKVPSIKYIKEIPQDFSIKYGLPIKVDGNLDEFNSDYAIEDNERKERLTKIYGTNYSQELGENQRPESMKEYLERIGFTDSPELEEKIKLLGYSKDDFTTAVDISYSRGQRYGQTERVMGSPFRISDLETCIANGNIKQLKAIMDFSEMQNNNFTKQLAEIYGKNVAALMNNGWESENLMHRQDFSLTGECCDDSYFNIFEKQEILKEKYKTEPYKIDAEMAKIKRRYTGQVMHFASCIKVVQDAMKITGKEEKDIDNILETYIDSFTNNLDLKKINENQIVENLNDEFRPGQNWPEKMAELNRKEGPILEDQIYNAHIENKDFYSKVSNMIAEKIQDKEISSTKNEPNKLFIIMSKIINKIKNKIKKDDTKMLPEASQEIKEETNVKSNTRNDFTNSLKYDINLEQEKELQEFINKQKNIQKNNSSKDQLNLDD